MLTQLALHVSRLHAHLAATVPPQEALASILLQGHLFPTSQFGQ